MKSFESILPSEYREVYRINALDKKVGTIMNVVALAISAVVILLLLIPIFLGAISLSDGELGLITVLFTASVGILIYMVLHELVHGAAYKLMTGEKLTFGLSWSCAFCGVPSIYVSRRTALISLVAPLITFTVLFGALIAVFYFVSAELYLAFSIIFAMHLGGCSGDMFVTLLLLFKLRDPRLLMRDTGPEQTFYLPETVE